MTTRCTASEREQVCFGFFFRIHGGRVRKRGSGGVICAYVDAFPQLILGILHTSPESIWRHPPSGEAQSTAGAEGKRGRVSVRATMHTSIHELQRTLPFLGRLHHSALSSQLGCVCRGNSPHHEGWKPFFPALWGPLLLHQVYRISSYCNCWVRALNSTWNSVYFLCKQVCILWCCTSTFSCMTGPKGELHPNRMIIINATDWMDSCEILFMSKILMMFEI